MSVILPPARIGFLGGGQLARMSAKAARRMGYDAAVLSPEASPPAVPIAQHFTCENMHDIAAAERFARACDVVALETENIPIETARAVERITRLYPTSCVLEVAQDRLMEKQFAKSGQVPIATFAPVRDEQELAAAADIVPFPAILKSARGGYDGLGQIGLKEPGELADAWARLGRVPCVLEQRVDLAAELSVVIASNGQGEVVAYEPFENRHRDHILDVCFSPSVLPGDVQQLAMEEAHRLIGALEYRGLLCVEYFLTTGGELLMNELAPRPHNSGHLTIDAHVTSQFEQHIRAVCGLPLGSTRQLTPAAMANLLGQHLGRGRPDFAAALAGGQTHLHLYGKLEARRGRKMGHLTSVADQVEAAISAATAARGRLRPVGL